MKKERERRQNFEGSLAVFLRTSVCVSQPYGRAGKTDFSSHKESPHRRRLFLRRKHHDKKVVRALGEATFSLEFTGGGSGPWIASNCGLTSFRKGTSQ
jgi:hypothetical protein